MNPTLIFQLVVITCLNGSCREHRFAANPITAPGSMACLLAGQLEGERLVEAAPGTTFTWRCEPIPPGATETDKNL
jgi:hypothetical protein